MLEHVYGLAQGTKLNVPKRLKLLLRLWFLIESTAWPDLCRHKCAAQVCINAGGHSTVLLSVQRLCMHAGLWSSPHVGRVVSARHYGHELRVRPRAARDPHPCQHCSAESTYPHLLLTKACTVKFQHTPCTTISLLPERFCMSCWDECMTCHQCSLHFILDYREQLTELMDGGGH
jgi:hypothetical protein